MKNMAWAGRREAWLLVGVLTFLRPPGGEAVASAAPAGLTVDEAPSIVQPGKVDPATKEAPSPHYSLADALEQLALRHPAMQLGRTNAAAAKGTAVDMGLWQNPVINGSWTTALSQAKSYDDAGYFNFGLSQFIELAGAPSARRRAGNLLARAAARDQDALYLSLALDVEEAMIAYVSTSRQVAGLREVVVMLAEVQRIVEQRVSAGAAPRYDLARIRITIAQSQALLEAAQAGLVRAGSELQAAIGPGATNLHGSPDYALESERPMPGLEAALGLVGERPDLKAAVERAASAAEQTSAARRSVFPGVGLQVGGGYGQSPGQVDFGVGLNIPIPLINRGQGAVAAAEARQQGAKAFAEGTIAIEKQRAQGVYAEVLRRRQSVVSFGKSAVSVGDEMLAESKAGYIAGRFSVLELADAYTSWRDLRARYVELLASARRAEVDLARAIGGVRLGAEAPSQLHEDRQ